MFEKFGSIAVVLAATLAFVGSAPTLADHADIVVSQAWSRATPKGAKVAGTEQPDVDIGRAQYATNRNTSTRSTSRSTARW